MSERLIKQTMADNIVIDTNCLVMMVSARNKHFQVLHQVQFPVVDVIGIDDYLQIISS